jgi:hypothetical protein
MDRRLLRIYLTDHRAAAEAGTALANRTARNNEGNPFGPPLAEVAQEIREDKASLDQVMARAGIARDRVKELGAMAAERAGRLKLNGRLTSYSPLSRVVELEGLCLAVQGKRGMWVIFRELVAAGTATADELGTVEEFDRLRARAEDQHGRLEELRLKAAVRAFAARDDG